MSFISDLFGNQSVGSVLGNAVAGALSGTHNNNNDTSGGSGGGIGIPVKASVDKNTINSIFGWVAGIVVIIVGAVLLTRKPKRRY